MAIVKFPSGHTYYGYGYDIGNDRAISYKRNSSGQPVGDAWTATVKINGRTVTWSALRYEANVIQNHTALQKSKTVEPVALTGSLRTAYILFSTRHECSQYFSAGTSIGTAVAIFVERGFFDLTLADVQILNPLTGVIQKPKAHTVVTYTFE